MSSKPTICKTKCTSFIFICSIFNSFNKYFIGTYCVLATLVSCREDTKITKIRFQSRGGYILIFLHVFMPLYETNLYCPYIPGIYDMSMSPSGFLRELTSASYLCFSRIGPEPSALLRKAWLIKNVNDGS